MWRPPYFQKACDVKLHHFFFSLTKNTVAQMKKSLLVFWRRLRIWYRLPRHSTGNFVNILLEFVFYHKHILCVDGVATPQNQNPFANNFKLFEACVKVFYDEGNWK